VAEIDGVRWYDDSKGTNVGATAAAIDGMDRPLVLIAGGDAKEADFTPLRGPVERRARAVVLIGRDADRLAAALEGAVPIERAHDLEDAVERAARLAAPGEAVLLSPACASFDMFTDYHARGEAFAAAVRERAA
jgi:UDP-N-acetylmuramoylalanine--D-glutamate ligase